MTIINKISVLLSLLLALSLQLMAGGESVVFTGRITSLQQEPVAFYTVTLQKSSDSLDFVETFTDENGIYFEEMKIDQGEVVTVSVMDCQNIEQYKFFYTPDSVNVADFSICTSSGNCYAFFMEEQDSSDMMAYRFYNLSEGNYNKIVWDFDDGTNSYEENPYHVFQQEGIYNVSLMIMDTSSPTGCFDVFMQVVVAGEVLPSVANFTFSLDTLNNTPFVYHFSNQSAGDSLSFFWDFGDGDFSEEKSPVHTYLEGGEYEVTLFVQDLSGFCFDEATTMVITPNYYNFGGQAFMGDYPINIDPGDSSNIAVASLYRKMEGRWHFVDKREFWQLGYYWFVDKLEGDYLIEIRLNNKSADYANYAPGYFKHAAQWQDASTFTLEGDVFEESVNLTPLAPLDNGIFKISGLVTFDSTRTGNITDTLPGALVQLFNQEDNMIKYTYSNQLGEYTFDNLPGGTYFVKGEVVGICSGKTSVSLSDENPFEDNARVTLFDCGNIGIDENPARDNLDVVVYPVPAINNVSVKLSHTLPSIIDVNVCNVQGAIIVQKEFLLLGNDEFQLNTRTWPNGIYLLNIYSNNKHKLLSKKIIVSH